MTNLIDIECWRCTKKLGFQTFDAYGVEIPCPRCHANNAVQPVILPLDNLIRVGATIGATV